MTPLDAITWALIVLGIYLGTLAVKMGIYGATPYEALAKPDKLIYIYGQLWIGTAMGIVVILIAKAVLEIVLFSVGR